MRQATVSFGDGLFEALGLTAFRDAGVRDAAVLSCDGAAGVVRVRVDETVPKERLEEIDAVEWWERVATEGPGCVYVFEADRSDADGATDIGTDEWPRVERIQAATEGITLTYVGSQAQLSAVVADAKANGTDVTLRRLRDYEVRDSAVDALTVRQREVLEIAFERGYYDHPRNASTGEIADELDLNDSTVSEHLQRAERNLVAAVLDL